MDKIKETPEIQELKIKLKEEMYKQLKNQIKKEVLTEIYSELKAEEKENGGIAELKAHKKNLTPHKEETIKSISEDPKIEQYLQKNSSILPESTISKQKVQKREINTLISVKSILKISSHAKKYANKNIPRNKWVEVIGLLAGKLNKSGEKLLIEDAYPMGHGNAIHAEIKDYKNYVRAFRDLKKKGLFICGWYHSHPSYGLFLSSEDIGTQERYQKLWNKSVALVIDPYQIDGINYGFKIFRCNLTTGKWKQIPFKIKGDLDPKSLPELLDFINPVIEGKALFLEYDENN